MSLPHPILGERIARHGFATRPAADPAAAAALVCGIQAQDGPASRLGAPGAVRLPIRTCSTRSPSGASCGPG
ncbi:hypothetical protein M6B22_00545 [Jatrophihabitans cynanchi]|uniref:Uncharacterized protein n=1 Tax=Jatrophihabitans cynanchi TaxID=2944128 RepID=A0ABY7K1T1_9ACTN|nr:hypothetical protein [Jatrophihabitans sp. SB3-54]WAX57271.1 hypothetical protein M6B22_00545 [Jatrophihabitans sp. SB3-54]